MLRATVFDLEDTLIDSGAAWVNTWAAYTARHGHRWTAADSAAAHGNDSWSSYISTLCGGLPASQVARDCSQVMVSALAGGGIRLLPGAARLTAEAGRYGPLALVSPSSRRFVQAAVSHFGLADRFRAVVCGEDVSHPKPAPDAYLLAAEELATSAGDCVAVDDSLNGIRSAHAAGMTVLAIPRPGSTLPADVRTLVLLRASDAVEAVALLPLLYRRFDPPRQRKAPAAVPAAQGRR
jgi:HAD superfamily hydrolase (TIGR01509 family)